MNISENQKTQIVHLGRGSLEKLSPYLEKEAIRSIFLLSGDSVWECCGTEISALLAAYQVIRFRDYSKNPTEQDVQRGLDEFLKWSCDVIIALGGGSTIDLGKLICMKSSLIVNRKEKKVVKLVAVPTTAGTGSEATQFAVFYRDGKKQSADSPLILPDLAIVEPRLSYSMPPYLAAVTAVDALAQAIESYWNIHSTFASQHYAEKALSLIWPNIEIAVSGRCGENIPSKGEAERETARAAKTRVVEGAHYAGKAINLTRTTAPHAFSYYFTTHHNIPHGHAVALSLANVLLYNYGIDDESCNDERGPAYVKEQIEKLTTLLCCTSVIQLAETLQKKFENIGLALTVQPYLASEHDKEQFCASINFERLSNNPRLIQRKNLSEIFSLKFT